MWRTRFLLYLVGEMKRKEKGNSLRMIWYFLGRYKFHFMLLILVAIVIGFVESLSVALMQPILANGLEINYDSNIFLNFVNQVTSILPIQDELIRYSIIFISLAIVVFIAKLFYFYFSLKITAMIVINAKKEIFRKCMNSDYQFFVDNKQGEILYKTSTAPNNLVTMLNILSNVFVELLFTVSVFILLFSISWKASILIIMGGVGYYYLTKYLSMKVHYISGKHQLESGQTEAVIINEYTTGAKQIKVFGTYNYWRNLYDKAIHTFWKYQRKGSFWAKVPELSLILLLYLGIGAAVLFIKVQYPGSFTRTIPVIGTFAFAVLMLLPKVSNFGHYRMNFMNVLPSIEAVYHMVKDKTYSTIKNGTKQFTTLDKGIELKNVKFSYKEREVLFKDISLDIEKDKVTALVGPSGSGKSTIVNLILRLHDADDGGVYINGTNVKEYDIFTFLRKVGFVSQDTFIYNASIRDNIAFGQEYTDQEVIETAKLANADEFIQKLPEKYDTIVGDRGSRLSGGEKQRLAIARAMIRKPEILLLDEATSSLDNISENIVQKAINKVSKNCTTFIIAHRLSTIQNADKIYVLDEGKIVEGGTHQELLKKKGKYWELYNIQKEK